MGTDNLWSLVFVLFTLLLITYMFASNYVRVQGSLDRS